MERPKLTPEDKEKALKLSQAISDFFKAAKVTNVRSTDLFDYLSNHKMIEWDRHQGIHFRSFLKKLKNAGALDLIPQCKPAKGYEETTEWHFVNVPALGNGRKLRSIGNTKTNTIDSEDTIRSYIDMLPHRPDELLIPSERQLRGKHKRAFDPWTQRECEHLLALADKINIEKLAELFQRQEHVLKNKIEQLKKLKEG